MTYLLTMKGFRKRDGVGTKTSFPPDSSLRVEPGTKGKKSCFCETTYRRCGSVCLSPVRSTLAMDHLTLVNRRQMDQFNTTNVDD